MVPLLLRRLEHADETETIFADEECIVTKNHDLRDRSKTEYLDDSKKHKRSTTQDSEGGPRDRVDNRRITTHDGYSTNHADDSQQKERRER